MSQHMPTVGSLVLRALARRADHLAFRQADREFSGRATADLIARMQRVIGDIAPRGSRVALLGGNRAEIWCAGIAAQLSGMVVSWLHPLASLDNQRGQLEAYGADLLIVDAVNHGARGCELAADPQLGCQHLALGPAGHAPDLLALCEQAGSCTPVDLSRPDEIATINFTGGTTGKSKGAVRRHSVLAASTVAIMADFDLPETPRYLAAGPISHVTGTKILPTLLRGGSVHLLPRFDVGEFCSVVERQKINTTTLVPTMIYSLLDSDMVDRADLSSLELLLYGASAMSPSRLVEGIERIGPIFSQLYGQTECYPIAVMPKADHDPARPEILASCGFPVTSCDVRLLGDDGNAVAAGEAGEICVRGPYVMDYYLDEPELTEETLAGGWLRTGDVARADEEGRLFIVDRKKDMIVTGGFNVYPREVEDVLAGAPGVAAAAVIGVPDPRWGEAVTAIIVPRTDERIDPEALIALVRSRCGNVQAPKRIEIADSLPLTSIGKIDKKALRHRYWEGQDRMIG